MIDIESELFAQLSRFLNDKFGDINVTSDYVNAPASFPHVSFVEVDNYVIASHSDSSNKEKAAELTYEVNVYSNKRSGRKAECRLIMAELDGWMYRHNFRRYSMTPVPNMENATIYRLTARYRGVSNGKTIYRR